MTDHQHPEDIARDRDGQRQMQEYGAEFVLDHLDDVVELFETYADVEREALMDGLLFEFWRYANKKDAEKKGGQP
ncbi:MAG: hypothetical protein ACK4N5_05350 [Myxococcales bacterium]